MKKKKKGNTVPTRFGRLPRTFSRPTPPFLPLLHYCPFPGLLRLEPDFASLSASGSFSENFILISTLINILKPVRTIRWLTSMYITWKMGKPNTWKPVRKPISTFRE